MIAVVDYGVGNLFSLCSSLQTLGLQVCVTADAAVLQAADRIILPGVGAFGDAVQKLQATGLVPVLRQQALASKLIRIHVLAASDAAEDQAVKLKIRDAVVEYLQPVLQQHMSLSKQLCLLCLL